MGGAAEAKTVGEEASPVVTIGVSLRKALGEEVALAIFPMCVVEIAPVPGGDGVVFVAGDVSAGHAFVEIGLGFEEALEGGAGEFAGIPGMIGLNLRIAHAGKERCVAD